MRPSFLICAYKPVDIAFSIFIGLCFLYGWYAPGRQFPPGYLASYEENEKFYSNPPPFFYFVSFVVLIYLMYTK